MSNNAAIGLMEELVHEIEKYISDDENNFVAKQLGKFEAATKVKRLHVVYGIVSLVGIYLVMGHGAELLCNFIAMAYPSYASIKAIKSTDKTDDTQWLTYWTVFGVFSLVDFASDKICGFFPIYWLVKCVFMAWLWMPFFKGAQKTYVRVIEPMFDRFGAKIDAAAAEQKGNIETAAVNAAVEEAKPSEE